MTQSLIREDRHDEVRLLLPWYVTGRLDPDEQALVRAHLDDCAACHSELAAERVLAGAFAARQPEAPAPAWERIAARLDEPRSTGVRHAAPPPRRRTRDVFAGLRRAAVRPATLRWAVAAQFVAVLALGASLANQPPAAPYRVLGDAADARPGNVLAMFRPQTTEGHLRRVLQASGARLVDGPTSANAYLLEVPGGEDGGALARLRRDPDVTMAEPIAQAPAG